MNYRQVGVRELVGWGLDDYEFRPKDLDQRMLSIATSLAAQRIPSTESNVVVDGETAELRDAFLELSSRPDLLAEVKGLTWSLGVVDLRNLIAFQRRLYFNSELCELKIPSAQDWPALLSLCFGPPQPVRCDVIEDTATGSLVVQSTNPNLHIRITTNAASPISLHAGSPFFEVACLRGRWFLRDGYHRAYGLMKAGVFEVPAIVVQAKTIEELGAGHPWFFPEAVLFSVRPPQVSDFLNDNLILEYDRPRLLKTVRISMAESLAPITCTGENL
jgi:hypothetical protein